MNYKITFFCFFASIMILSCSNNLLPIDDSGAVTENSNASQEPSLVYDSSRNITQFVDGTDQPIDIVSDDEETGPSKCVEPIDFKVFPEDNSGRSAGQNDSLRAVVVGMRDDSKPGIWLVFRSGNVESPLSEKRGIRSSRLDDATEHADNAIGREVGSILGWVFHPTTISDDGFVIGGYAYNEDGFDSPLIKIEPKSQAAVYWNLKKNRGGHWMVSRAHVVGILPESDNSVVHQNWFRKIIDMFKLFFLDYLDNYLVDVDSITYKENDSLYLIQGDDIHGNQSVAEMIPGQILSINPVETGNESPSVIFSDYDYEISGSDQSEVNGDYYYDNSLLNQPAFSNNNGVYIFMFFDNDDYNIYWGIGGDPNIGSRTEAYYYVLYPMSDLNPVPPDSNWLSGISSGTIQVSIGTPIIGFPISGGSVAANYQFSDPDGDSEGSSLFQWYLCSTDSDDDEGSAISGATSETFSIPDAFDLDTTDGTVTTSGKYLKVKITPVDDRGLAGTPVLSRASIMPFPS